jgi:hypothetical protein
MCAGLERVKWLARFGNDSYGNIKKYRVRPRKTGNKVMMTVETTGLRRKKADEIRVYMENLLQEAKLRGEEHIDLVSGDIHRQMGLKKGCLMFAGLCMRK